MNEDEICQPSCQKFGLDRLKKIEKHSKNPNYVLAVGKRDFPPQPLPEDDGTYTLYERDQEQEEPHRKVVINLPAYIVNSHDLRTSPMRDVSKLYNLQLKSPDNENLYVLDHHVLLQVMSQYVYYRKLCIWIKDELKKKRLELLEAARKALIDARDGEDICNCDPRRLKKSMPDRLLTDVEKQFLQKLVEGKTDMASLYVPRKSTPAITPQLRSASPKASVHTGFPMPVPPRQQLPDSAEEYAAKKKGGCCVIL